MRKERPVFSWGNKPVSFECDYCKCTRSERGVVVKTNRTYTDRHEYKNICKECWNTDTFASCRYCGIKFGKPSDISYIDNNDTFVCKTCDKREVFCCHCKKIVCFSKCGKNIIEGKPKFLCHACLSNPETKICRECWGPISDRLKAEHRYKTITDLCAQCYDSYISCNISS